VLDRHGIVALMAIQAGHKIPQATLRTLTADGLQTVETPVVFGGKKVVLFAVPGAFTPTCNNDHLPTFLENADAIKAKGVDEIVCVAVNDPFVMDAWAKANDAGDRITFLSDGNAELANALGMTFDGSGFGLGARSLRYAAVIEDGTVKALEVEENPGQCSVTTGEKILAHLG